MRCGAEKGISILRRPQDTLETRESETTVLVWKYPLGIFQFKKEVGPGWGDNSYSSEVKDRNTAQFEGGTKTLGIPVVLYHPIGTIHGAKGENGTP